MLHPLLFAGFPVVFLVAQNPGEVLPSEVPAPLGLSLAGAGLLFLVLTLALRKRSKAAVLTSVATILFFSFGHLATAVEPLAGPSAVHFVLIASVVVLALTTAGVVRSRSRFHHVNRLLSVTALTLYLLQTPGLVQFAKRPQTSAFLSGVEREVSPSPAPAGRDIFFIVLDGYGRSDVLETIYGYDNSRFLDALDALGFHVCTQSRSNYSTTLHALSSMLNMNYVHNLFPVDPQESSRVQLIRLIRKNAVVHNLRRVGYTITELSSGYQIAELARPDELPLPETRLSEFQSILIEATPLPYVLGPGSDPFELHRRSIEFILDELSHMKPRAAPRFVFAHLLIPHPPFVFDRDGGRVEHDRTFGLQDGSDYYRHGGTHDEYVSGYAEQIRFTTRRIEDTVRAVLEHHAERPPIVVLLSDHGPGSQLDWINLHTTNLHERFGILWAAYLPGHENIAIPEDFSPVNTFRLIFNLYFDGDFGLLDHASYYLFMNEPYRFIDVTDAAHPREFTGSPR